MNKCVEMLGIFIAIECIHYTNLFDMHEIQCFYSLQCVCSIEQHKTVVSWISAPHGHSIIVGLTVTKNQKSRVTKRTRHRRTTISIFIYLTHILLLHYSEICSLAHTDRSLGLVSPSWWQISSVLECSYKWIILGWINLKIN